MSSSYTLFSNASWSLTARITNISVKVIAVIYLARYLGPGEFGIFTLIISTVALFSVFVDLGISPATARLLAEDIWNNKKIISISIKVIFGLFALFSGIFLLFGNFFFEVINANVINEYTLIFLVLIFLQVFHQFYTKCFEGLRRVDVSSKLTLALSWAPWGLALLSVFILGTSAKYAIIGKVAGTFLIVIGLFYFLKQLIGKSNINIKNGENIKYTLLVSYAIPMLVTAISFYIYTHSDILIIQAFLGETEVGIYGVAVRMLDTLHVPAAAIGTAAAAYFVNTRSKQSEKTINLFYTTSKWTLVLFFPLTIGLILTAGELFPLLFGDEYSRASLIAIIYAPTLLAKSLSATYSLALDYMGYSAKRAIAIAISATINIALNIILIPEFGIIGAAVTTQITYIPLVLWYTFTLKKLTNSSITQLSKNVLPTICAGLFMALFILVFNIYSDIHIIVKILIGLIIYICAGWYLGVFIKSDLPKLNKKDYNENII